MRSQKKFFYVFFALQSFYSISVCARVEAVIGPLPIKDNINLSTIVPTTNESEIIVSRDQYVISYNKNRNAPNWVAWKLEAKQIGKAGRSNNFQADPDLEKYLKVQDPHYKAITPDDFKGSCFDRGHQVPSADRTDTDVDNQETFLMSNMIPQTAHLNRVIWEHFERHTRDLVEAHAKKVYVIAGPIYDENYGSIGPKKNIPVPSKNFKVIVVLDENQNLSDINEKTQIISIIMPNNLADGSKPTNKTKLCNESLAPQQISRSTEDWIQYQVSIGEIEKAAGLKFTANSFIGLR